MSNKKKDFRQRLISLVVIAFVVALLAPVLIATPASATATLQVVPFTLTTTGSGTAQWTNVDKYTGSYSVSLTTSSAGDSAGVGISAYSGTIDSITSLSMWYKDVTYAGFSGPRISMALVNGSTNYLAVTGCAIQSLAWKQADAINGVANTDWYTPGTVNQIWWYGTWNGTNFATYSQIGGPVSFAALQSALTGSTVQHASAYMGVVDGVNVQAGSAYVDDPEINGTTYYGMVQDAVDAASSGDIINVAAGTYNEQVVINKSLTLQGADDTSIIQPSGPGILTSVYTYPDGFSYYSGVKIAGIITIKNVTSGVTIKNLKVDGVNVTSLPAGAARLAGILYGASAGLIDNVTVNTIKTTGYADRTYGIDLSGGSTAVSVEVKNSRITDWGRNGIMANGINLTANIHDNILTGPGTIGPAQVPNGIVFMADVGGTISRNTISGCHYNVPLSWEGFGIMQFDVCAPGVVIENNTVSDCDQGVGPTNNVIIRNNTLINNHGGVRLETLICDNNQIVGNNILNNSEGGIILDGSTCPNPYGQDPPGTHNVAHFNNIVGNAMGVVNYDPGQTFDAINNWWGNAGGPGVGGANGVNGTVDYTPWLGELYAPTKTTGTATGTGVASFTSDSGALEDLAAVDVVTLPPPPAGVSLPHGLFSFRITGVGSGATVTVTVTLPSAVPVGTLWYKYDASVGWISLPIGSDNGDNVITITITDGGTGDFDPTSGAILDPGGPGLPPPAPAAMVGGIAEYLVGGSDSSSPPYAVIIGGAMAALAVLALGGWFAKRRWLRRCS